jgi:hypothetical protein
MLVFLFASVSLVSVAGPAHAMDKNCSDFNTQAQAQAYYNQQGPGDPDGLDADGDGVACESNPCPCSNGGGGGGGGGGTHQKPFHNLTAGKTKVSGKPFAVGKVTTYKGQRIRVLRRVEGGPFKLFKSTVTKKATGQFKVSIKSPKNKTSCFRVTVPATKKYKLTTKPVGCIG